MAWTPISGTVPQYSTSANELASDYWLKFYLSGTTTPYSVATDSTGASTLAKIKLSNVGYPISNPLDNDTIFIPHVEVAYRIVLYQSEADADANDTANAAFNIDGISPDIAQLATDDNIAMNGTTLQAQDDYDRSPLFVNGTDFTAGAGPHTITVPSEWTPTNADMRFYRLASNGVVTDLTPTSKSATTFTIAETLLSTDTLYIGDDTFRNQMDGDPSDIRDRIGAATSVQGTLADNSVQKSTVITGHVRVGNTQLWNGRAGQGSTIDIASVMAEGVYETIGATGSGADNVWAAMNVIPSNAKAILVNFRVQFINASLGESELTCAISDGDDASPSVGDMVKIVDYIQAENQDSNPPTSFNIMAVLPLGATNKDFYAYWTESDTELASIVLDYRGFMTD